MLNDAHSHCNIPIRFKCGWFFKKNWGKRYAAPPKNKHKTHKVHGIDLLWRSIAIKLLHDTTRARLWWPLYSEKDVIVAWNCQQHNTMLFQQNMAEEKKNDTKGNDLHRVFELLEWRGTRKPAADNNESNFACKHLSGLFDDCRQSQSGT